MPTARRPPFFTVLFLTVWILPQQVVVWNKEVPRLATRRQSKRPSRLQMLQESWRMLVPAMWPQFLRPRPAA